MQRAMIAMALALKPSLLIADEPTTSLDVTVQAQIIELLRDLRSRFDTSLLLITHDLAIASQLCDTVAVMYAGGLVEKGAVQEVFCNPKHPYTEALLGAASGDLDHPIGGNVPELSALPFGCRFHPRCPVADAICEEIRPKMMDGICCHRHIRQRQEVLR